LEDDEGQELTLDVTYTPVRPEEGPLQYIIGTLRDIGERRALEDQLIQSKKLASLGTLVAGIAHELRNPLGVILSAAEILVNEGRTQPQRRAAAHLILDETRRVDKSIKEFLAFARPRTLRSEQMDIIPLLQRSVELHVTHDRGCRLQITEEFEADLPSVDVDADQMRQVFDNLLANAEGSKSEPAEPVHLTLRARRDGKRHLRIDFADDGDGILAENLPHIHDPFFTTKREGTGLGLSIVLQIMTDHRGRLLVHSEPGRGTTFSLVLPIPEEMVR